MRLAVFDVVFGAGANAEQDERGHFAVLRLDHRGLAVGAAGHFRAHGGDAFCVKQVGLVQDDEVGAGQLILEQFLDRALMVQIVVFGALGSDRVVVVGEATGGDGCAIDNSDHTIDGHAGADVRPVEGGDQRLRQGETRGFDDDVVRLHVAVEQLLHGRDEIVGHCAADAAIGELDDVVLGAVFGTATLQHVAIDAEIAEFVDDQRDLLAACIG